MLLPRLCRNFVYDHVLVRVALGCLDGVHREEDFSVAVTRVARGVLRGLALNVVRRRHSPTGNRIGIRKRDAIALEQICIRRHVAHDGIVVRTLCRLVGILADLEIEPRRIEGAERQPLGVFAGVTVRAVLVRDRVAHLAGQFILVQRVLRDPGVRHRVFVTRLASHRGFVPHRRAQLPVAVRRRALVTGHTRHLQFARVYVTGNEIIVAEELVADARAVTRGTRFFD